MGNNSFLLYCQLFNNFFGHHKCPCTLGVIILMIFMASDTWCNIKYNQLVRSIKRNDTVAHGNSPPGVVNTLQLTYCTWSPPSSLALLSPIRPHLSASTLIMCFTRHYPWRWASALWETPKMQMWCRGHPGAWWRVRLASFTKGGHYCGSLGMNEWMNGAARCHISHETWLQTGQCAPQHSSV